MQKQDNQEMKTIINNLRANNMEYFDLFYDLTKKQVYYAIMNIVKNPVVAEDIMQDTYMRFLNNLHRYKNHTNVIAFIVTIARNLSINMYNKQKREVMYDFSQYEDTYQSHHVNNDHPLLDIVYETLSHDELEVFILHTIDELKHREIAKVMKKPLGTITWLYNKAVKKLREKVGENNE